jgi:steroid 5-alpha reductase family enzyme
MNEAETQSLIATPLIVGVGAAIAWAGSQGGATVGALPLFALCAMLSFGLNWLVFVHAYLAQTERFFDLTGSITYVSVIAVSLALTAELDARSLLLGAMVLAWAVRLGSFLFARIRRDGSDGRFDALKPSLPRFLMTWTLQGLWVLLTVACALAAITTERPVPLGGFAALGTLIWSFGFAVEVIADREKSRFRGDPNNRGRFIQNGIWAWSRHPNYFGEITLWFGVAIVAFPVLSGWQYATLISPVFVYLLLTRISGVPLLESRGKKKWGHEPEYQAYRARTPVLFPRPPRTS